MNFGVVYSILVGEKLGQSHVNMLLPYAYNMFKMIVMMAQLPLCSFQIPYFTLSIRLFNLILILVLATKITICSPDYVVSFLSFDKVLALI